ncbi:SH3 domain-binding glutamic acid-rich-like protein 2 isoform 3-T3 [Lycodopsis pacificus]
MLCYLSWLSLNTGDACLLPSKTQSVVELHFLCVAIITACCHPLVCLSTRVVVFGIKMVIRVYITSSTGSRAVKKHQQAVVGFLEANRISFQEVDVTMLEEQRLWMYRNIPRDKQPEKGNPLLPQIFNEDRYCGDYEDFFQSKEDNTVFAFLGLSSQPSVK